MRTTALAALAWIALVNTGTLLFLWWRAAPLTGGNWTTLVQFNLAGEAWLEGIFLHLMLVAVVVALANMKWLARR